MGKDVVEAFGLTGFESGRNPIALALEWGVRRLGERIELRTRAGSRSASRPTSSRRTTTTAASSSRSRPDGRRDHESRTKEPAERGWPGRARSTRTPRSAARPSTSRPERRRYSDVGRQVASVACDIRDPDQITSAFDAATAAFGLPSVLVNNAAANFPVPAEDMSPNAWRTVVDITLNGTFFCAPRVRPPPPRSRLCRIDRERRGVLRVDRRTGLRTLGRSEGGREEHGGDAGGRVGALRHPGERAGARPVPPRRHDRRHQGQHGPHEREEPVPARTPGGPARELGWAATFLASPFARFISGHTLVVDGANWQRRSLTNPAVITVRDQMGKGPFEP